MSAYVATDNITEQYTRALIEQLTTIGVGQQTPAGPLPMLTVKAKPAKPDRIIAVTCYTVLASYPLRTTSLKIQLWSRGKPGDPFDADRIGDTAFNDLHGTRRATWSGLEIGLIEHKSSAQLGPDDTGRYARSDNYTLTTQRRS